MRITEEDQVASEVARIAARLSDANPKSLHALRELLTGYSREVWALEVRNHRPDPTAIFVSEVHTQQVAA